MYTLWGMCKMHYIYDLDEVIKLFYNYVMPLFCISLLGIFYDRCMTLVVFMHSGTGRQA